MSLSHVPVVDHPVEYTLGVDLAKTSDFTALALLKRTPSGGEPGTDAYDLISLARWRGVHNPEIVRRVETLASKPELRPFVEREVEDESDGHMTPIRRTRSPKPKLAVDASGVGIPIVDMLLTKTVTEHVDVVPVTITAGEAWSQVTWGGASSVVAYRVSKRELVSLLVARLQSKLLRFIPGDSLSAELDEELRNFDLKQTKAGNETFEARNGKTDDLILAVSIALWVAERPSQAGWWGPNLAPRGPRMQTVEEIIASHGRPARRGQGGAFLR